MRKILLVKKESELERNIREFGDLNKIKPEDLNRVNHDHKEHYESVELVKKVLKENRVMFDEKYPFHVYEEDVKEIDAVFTIGGDGMVLQTSKYIRNSVPILPIKSEKSSVGAVCKIDATEGKENVYSLIKKVLEGNYSVEKWTRIEGRMGEKIDIALNDVCICHKFGPGEIRYEICHNGKTENQSGCGVLITSGCGSTAWYKNVKGSEGPFEKTSEELKYIARDERIDAGYDMTKGTILPKDEFKVFSRKSIHTVVSFDSDFDRRMYELKYGDYVEIKKSDRPLKVITP